MRCCFLFHTHRLYLSSSSNISNTSWSCKSQSTFSNSDLFWFSGQILFTTLQITVTRNTSFPLSRNYNEIKLAYQWSNDNDNWIWKREYWERFIVHGEPWQEKKYYSNSETPNSLLVGFLISCKRTRNKLELSIVKDGLTGESSVKVTNNQLWRSTTTTIITI